MLANLNKFRPLYIYILNYTCMAAYIICIPLCTLIQLYKKIKHSLVTGYIKIYNNFILCLQKIMLNILIINFTHSREYPISCSKTEQFKLIRKMFN